MTASQLIRDLQSELLNLAGINTPNQYGIALLALMEKYNPENMPQEAVSGDLLKKHAEIGHFIPPMLEDIYDFSKLNIRGNYPSDGELIRSQVGYYDQKLLSLARLQKDYNLGVEEVQPIEAFIQQCKKVCQSTFETASEEQLRWTGLEVDLDEKLTQLWATWRECWDNVDPDMKTDITKKFESYGHHCRLWIC